MQRWTVAIHALTGRDDEIMPAFNVFSCVSYARVMCPVLHSVNEGSGKNRYDQESLHVAIVSRSGPANQRRAILLSEQIASNRHCLEHDGEEFILGPIGVA